MELTEAIYERRAVRDFLDEPISEAALHAVIDAAVQAPSAMNRQPWAFAVVSGRQAVAELGRRAKSYLMSIDKPEEHPTLREHLELSSFELFYNAPTLIVVHTASANPAAARDCALAAQNLMLAAWDRGLGTCWIGLSEPWLNTAEGKAAAGVPADATVVAPIIIGRPRTRPPAPPREPAKVKRTR